MAWAAYMGREGGGREYKLARQEKCQTPPSLTHSWSICSPRPTLNGHAPHLSSPLTLSVERLVEIVLPLVEPVLAQDECPRRQAEGVRTLDLRRGGRRVEVKGRFS